MEHFDSVNNRVVVGSFAWKMMERIISQGINFVVQIILARLLAPEAFASLAIIVAITNYAALFVQSGLSVALIQKEDLKEIDVSTLLVSSLVIAAVFYTALFAAAPWFALYYNSAELTGELRVLAVVLFFNAVNSVQLALLQRNMEFKALFFRSLIAVLVSGSVGIGMAFMGYGVWALIANNLLYTATLVLVIFLHGKLHLHLAFSWDSAKTLYRFSGKILLASLISGLHDTVRTMLIGKKYSRDDLAYYDKAYTYSFYVVQTVGYSISSVMLPVFSRQQGDLPALKATTRESIRFSAFFMFPLLTGIVVVARPLVLLLLTEKWLPCVPFLMLFCILRLPECMITIDKQVFYAVGKSELCLYYEIGLCLCNLAVLMVAMNYGILYIAVGAVLVQLLAGVVIGFISSRTIGYTIVERVKDIARPTVNSCGMAAVVLLVQRALSDTFLSLVLQVLTGIAVYFVLALVSRDESFKKAVSLVKSRAKKM